jgi:RNA polymerase sigma-70 factor, ECF subfamily
VTSPDEERLLKDLRAGRPDACAELIRVHHRAVYRLLVHLTRDVHRAEDLTQETFAAAWQKIGGFRGKASLGTWLHRIAYTKFIDAQRARVRDDEARERLVRPPADSPDPFEAVAADDESRQLFQTLDELVDADCEVLVLHYVQGLSYREMAVVLDEPAGTVKWRIHLAINRLRELLPEYLRSEVNDHAV